MKPFERDLRFGRLPCEPHLPASLRWIVVAYYILLGIGSVVLVAICIHWMNDSRGVQTLDDELRQSETQIALLESVIGKLDQRRELISDIEAWMLDRYDLETVYHDCANVASDHVLIQYLGVQRKSEGSGLEVRVVVEGASGSYAPFFQRLTGYFTTAPQIKIADLQMDMRPDGAVLTLDLHVEGFSPRENLQITQTESKDH